MEKTKPEKMLNKETGRQQETRITAYTVILSAIVLNILWWTGIKFITSDSTDNITVNTSVPNKHYSIISEK